jgi:hypothetical protein
LDFNFNALNDTVPLPAYAAKERDFIYALNTEALIRVDGRGFWNPLEWVYGYNVSYYEGEENR